jgi:cytidylate kinase
MSYLAFLLVGGCLAVAVFLNAMLDKRAERRLKAREERRRQV